MTVRVPTSLVRRRIGALLDQVMRGDTIDLTRYGRVVARLSPVEGPKVGEVPVEPRSAGTLASRTEA